MHKSKLQSAFQASMESEEVVQPEVEETPGLEGGDDSMEAALLVCQEAADEAEQQTELVEELDEVSEGLEAIYDHMAATVEDGGLEPGAAAALNLAIESYTSRLGIDEPVMASMESFGGQSDRVHATTVSMEKANETISKIWKAIKSAIQKAMKAVADFFAKIFKGTEKIVERADKLKKMVEETDGNEAEGEVKISGAGKLHVGGKVDGETIVSGLNTMSEVVGGFYTNYAEGVADYYEEIGAFVKENQEIDDSDKLEEALGGLEGGAKLQETIKGLTDKEFSGGVVVTVEEGEDGKISLPKIGPAGEKGPDESVEIEALSTGQMNSVCETVKSTAEMIGEKKKTVEKIEKARKDANKAADDFAKAGDKNALGKAWEKNKVKTMLNRFKRDAARPLTQMTSHSFSVMRSALGVVEKCTKARKGSGDKKEESED